FRAPRPARTSTGYRHPTGPGTRSKDSDTEGRHGGHRDLPDHGRWRPVGHDERYRPAAVRPGPISASHRAAREAGSMAWSWISSGATGPWTAGTGGSTAGS